MPIPVESFFLTPGAGGTLQQQIRQMVADGILSGRFRAGERLPSSRGLADHLGISRITVTLAYTELVAGDYLAARGRSGHFVSANAPRPPDFAPRAPQGRGATGGGVDWDRVAGRRFSDAPELAKPADWRSYPYPFIYGQADAALFDHQNWRACALMALGRKDFDALTDDYHTRDDPMLIDYILRTILPRRGIAARPEEVLLTMGAQNALWMAAAILAGPGRLAVQENPAYPGLRVILGQSGAARACVDVDEDGLPPDAIPKGAHVVFTTASHQSPTNCTMPVARRRALLDRARAQGFVVVEDDYEFEMSFHKSASPALKSLDDEGRVIYVGSFSKSLFPGLRLGYLVGAEPFIREARALRASVMRHPPGLIQRTAAHFLALGHYDSHLNRMAQTFRRRRQVMAEAIATSGLALAGPGTFGGSSFWMRAPEAIDCDRLAVALRAQGVLIEPGRLFFDPAAAPANHYRLAYSSIAQGRIAEGIALIAGAIAGWT
ncbi:MAG: PLP-dependent aminotransferase family protein [Proteobacteria bacterium]|nr:PLP-dependent aminotransferase family protein [Pseudomonadota bacterium]MBS0572358.1 PLP-dependent aminotransferase family protein [Pseudomonadota bacterium]